MPLLSIFRCPCQYHHRHPSIPLPFIASSCPMVHGLSAPHRKRRHMRCTGKVFFCPSIWNWRINALECSLENDLVSLYFVRGTPFSTVHTVEGIVPKTSKAVGLRAAARSMHRAASVCEGLAKKPPIPSLCRPTIEFEPVLFCARQRMAQTLAAPVWNSLVPLVSLGPAAFGGGPDTARKPAATCEHGIS